MKLKYLENVETCTFSVRTRCYSMKSNFSVEYCRCSVTESSENTWETHHTFLRGTGPFLTYKLGGICPPPVPPCAPPPPPRNHILHPQEKSLFPKIIQTNQRRLTN